MITYNSIRLDTISKEQEFTYPAGDPSLQVSEELESHTRRRLSGGAGATTHDAKLNTACNQMWK